MAPTRPCRSLPAVEGSESRAQAKLQGGDDEFGVRPKGLVGGLRCRDPKLQCMLRSMSLYLYL